MTRVNKKNCLWLIKRTIRLPLLGTLILGAGFCGTALSDDFDQLGSLTQPEFQTLSENIAAATHYKALIPAEPLGILGFDIAAEISSTDISSVIFDKASSSGFDLDTMLAARLHAHIGLPFKLDIGASLTEIPDTDMQVIGAEIRYSILEGGISIPAIAVRLTHSRVTGADEIALDHTGVEATISKGILMFTPYGGVGIVRTNSTPDAGSLRKVSFNQEKLFVGVNINWGINFAFEADKTGEYTTYSAKIGFRF